MKNKILNVFIIIVFVYFLGNISVLALDIADKKVCSDCSSTAYSTNKYQSNGEYKNRYITNMNGFKQGDQRVFCVEPTKLHGTTGYNKTDNYDTAKGKLDSNWKSGFEKQNDLKKVLSCWSENNNSIVATQAIVWEIIAEERNGINATKILSGDYVPYMANGKTFKQNSGQTAISNVLCPTGINNDTSGLCKSYRATLRCAARFNVIPSFAKTTKALAAAEPFKLTNYDDETQTFSRTIKHTGYDSSLLKYYDIAQVNGLTITKTNSSITISTKTVIKEKSDSKLITLNYTKKDNGTSNLNQDADYFYYKNKNQTLMQGSYDPSPSYIKVWTGPKPTYKLKVQKKDENDEPVKDVEFTVYKGGKNSTKSVGVIKTGSDGWAYLTGLDEVGEYSVKETAVPEGYIKSKDIATVNVTSSNRSEGDYAVAYITDSNNKKRSYFVNKFTHLKLNKKTIDEKGNDIDLKDYTGNNCTGNYTGPVFTINKCDKNGKNCSDICVVPKSKAGEYKLAKCSEANATNEIKTCGGKFDIEGATSGCYTAKEIIAPNNYTFPQNPVTESVCLNPGESGGFAKVYNGVTGVVFNKVSDSGEPIDGGKYALQQKKNGVYRDMLLKHDQGIIYVYEENLTEKSENATYLLDTENGAINVKHLPPGEYRFVEKEAPEGYDAIKDKDSTATFTVSDKGIFGSNNKPVTDYYQVRLVNQQSRVEGSYDSAELIVTITTGRKVINYTLVILSLALLLAILIILRKKLKK